MSGEKKMFIGTKGIVGNLINIEHVMSALEVLGYSPELKHIYKDQENESQGDAIINIIDSDDGQRELFVLWNYMDHYDIFPAKNRTIFNLAYWGNCHKILKEIVEQLGGGCLILNDKEGKWEEVSSDIET